MGSHLNHGISKCHYFSTFLFEYYCLHSQLKLKTTKCFGIFEHTPVSINQMAAVSRLSRCNHGFFSFLHLVQTCLSLNIGGVTRLLLMPGQRPGKPPTHAAHIHMSIFIWTSVFFSKYVVLAILYAKYLS